MVVVVTDIVDFLIFVLATQTGTEEQQIAHFVSSS